MTPQERQLVDELFDRLASLEGERRDADAERAISEGLKRAPHAIYALVQTVLVQDEALKRANAHIAELEQGGEAPPQGGFLDNIRDAVFGREERRGSVPSVRPSEPGHGSSVWGERYAGGQPAGAPTAPGQGQFQGQGYGQPGYGQPGPGYGGPFGGGSFLGTAAASAAGVIGGALLMNSLRGLFGHPQGQSAFDPSGGSGSPWDSGAGGNLAREAGLDDIGARHSASADEPTRTAGLFGGDEPSDLDLEDDVDYGGDSGGSDTA